MALGACTILPPAVGPRRLANLQGEEARLLALLSATYGKAISPSVLRNIERAAKSWRVGDDALAAIHLAHAALPRPDNPDEAARRLFVTDPFIKAGTNPLAILQALGLDAGYVETLAKYYYNELEPRVPAGNSILSGRWTKILSFLGDLTSAGGATRALGDTSARPDGHRCGRSRSLPHDLRPAAQSYPRRRRRRRPAGRSLLVDSRRDAAF